MYRRDPSSGLIRVVGMKKIFINLVGGWLVSILAVASEIVRDATVSMYDYDLIVH